MESTVLSVGKSVLSGALGYAQSAVAEEVALQLGIQRDHAFIRDELEMMRDGNRVVKAWVKQVRDTAYAVEDCLQMKEMKDRCTLLDRRRVAKEMKELRAKVEDVSQRNVRYRLIKGSGSKSAVVAEQSSSNASATMFGIEAARRAAKQDNPKSDLVQLIDKEGKDLRVIAVWGTSGDLGLTSTIKRAYDDLKIHEKFECRAWIRIVHPFNPTEFLHSIMRQFYANSSLEIGKIQEKATLGAHVLQKMGKMKQEDYVKEFNEYVNEKSYLIVLNDLWTIEDWDWIKTYFPNNKNGSRIIVATQKVEVASLCTGQESQISELKQLSTEQTLYVFNEKGYPDGIHAIKPGSSSNAATSTTNDSTVPSSEILEDRSKDATGNNALGKSLTRARTMAAVLEESHLVGREKEKLDIINLTINQASQRFEVISVWGMGGLGKTTLVRDVYQSQELSSKFEKRACVTVMRPLILEELLRGLVMQLDVETKAKDVMGLLGSTKKTLQLLPLAELTKELARLLEAKRCLIVIDDLSCPAEWNLIMQIFPKMEDTSRIIVTTREESVAKHCSLAKQENIYQLKVLEDQQAHDLFVKKGSQDGTNSKEAGSSSTATVITTSSDNSADKRSLNRIETMLVANLEGSQLIGRVNEKNEVIKLVSNRDSQQLEVISVWGMGGVGKTTLARDVYQDQELSGKFEKSACVTIMRPFILEELLGSLAKQFEVEVNNWDKGLGGKQYLIVLDDLLFSTEWDVIVQKLPQTAGSCIIVTTRQKNIAIHCSKEEKNIRQLNTLDHVYARDLFVKKVFKEAVDLDEQYPELVEQANLLLEKCDGLPLAIVTIGGFLANQPKSVVEWKKLNKHIGAELEMNPELGAIKTILLKSHDGLPYHLKSCFLYLSIYPEDHKISRKRLVHRWTAEGYSSGVRTKSAEEIADNYFMELISRSMILASQQSSSIAKGIDSCQVHDMMREVGVSKSMEENLVFRLEEGCSLNNHGTIRHLAISSTWEGDQVEFESIVDLSRIRSLTVFAIWRPFFISDKMRVLRVLDLEGTSGLVDHHLVDIGKLLHLRYLSLRGCDVIFHLPDSLGNLRQLQTLDIRGTSIVMLPKTIIKLRKLQYLHAGRGGGYSTFSRWSWRRLFAEGPGPCALCCVPRLMGIDGFNRRDACTFTCCAALPCFVMDLDHGGVLVPRWTRKIKGLHTLRFVDLGPGDTVLREIKRLGGLRKLGVVGINKKNGLGFCSAISNLSRLESLSVMAYNGLGLRGCLDDMSSPPETLQNLKLEGELVKLPEWIGRLKHLVKLKLWGSEIVEHDAAIQLLGRLPNLAILRLLWHSFEFYQGGEVRLNFHQEAFPSLVALQLDRVGALKSVEFKDEFLFAENRNTPVLKRFNLIR